MAFYLGLFKRLAMFGVATALLSGIVYLFVAPVVGILVLIVDPLLWIAGKNPPDPEALAKSGWVIGLSMGIAGTINWTKNKNLLHEGH